MAKLTLTNTASGHALISVLNANNDLIEAALENTLSRDGTGPNAMSAALDMNSQRIVDLPTAVNNSEPVTLGQANILAGVTSPLTQNSVGAVLYPQTAAEAAAAVTPTNLWYEPNDVRRFGVTGDGGTNDTAAIQSVLDFYTGTLIFPPGTYMSDRIRITNITGLHIIGYGATIRYRNQSVPESLQIDNTCADITIEGLRFKGDDVASEPNPQIGINVPDAATTDVSNINVKYCRFENLTNGVTFFSDALGAARDLHVDHCSFFEIAGVIGGTGYGVHINVGNAIGMISVTNSYFELCHRHAIYFAKGGPGVIHGNNVYRHRFGDGDLDLAAIKVARGSNVVVSSNVVWESDDTGILIEADITASQATCEHVSIVNNIVANGKAVDIAIGSGDAASAGVFQNMLVQGNTLIRSSATNFENSLEVRHCLGLVISNNAFIGPKTYASIYSSVQFTGNGESAGTADFTDDVTMLGNTFTYAGTNARPIRIDNLVANGSAKMVFSNNIFNISGAATPRAFHIPGTTHTNTNFEVIGQRSDGLAQFDYQYGGIKTFTAADATPSVKKGRVFKTDTGSLTITDFDDGEDGQEILVISKGAVTYDTTSSNLVGSSVDIVTANGDTTKWIADGASWRLLAFVDISVDNSAGA